MKTRHNVLNTTTTPVDPHKHHVDEDEFIARPKFAIEPSSSKDAAPAEQAEYSAENLVFTPDKIDNIPMRCIFNTPLKCGLCNYTNKVRTNFIRHFKMHLEEKPVPDSAPINPVPCLDKSEKMFDKMTNLAFNGFQGAKTQSKDKSKLTCVGFYLSYSLICFGRRERSGDLHSGVCVVQTTLRVLRAWVQLSVSGGGVLTSPHGRPSR